MEKMDYQERKQLRQKVLYLRQSAYSYRAIAEMTGLTKNTVQSICRRAGVKPDADVSQRICGTDIYYCKYCGGVFINPWHRKDKQFCSDNCRMRWWNEHRSTGKKEKPPINS